MKKKIKKIRRRKKQQQFLCRIQAQYICEICKTRVSEKLYVINSSDEEIVAVKEDEGEKDGYDIAHYIFLIIEGREEGRIIERKIKGNLPWTELEVAYYNPEKLSLWVVRRGNEKCERCFSGNFPL